MRNRPKKKELYRNIREKKEVGKKAGEEKKATSSLIVDLRKELKELKSELGADVEERPTIFKSKQTYPASIREVYQDLMVKHRVSSTTCEGVVRTVLEGLTDIPMDDVKLRMHHNAGRTQARPSSSCKSSSRTQGLDCGK